MQNIIRRVFITSLALLSVSTNAQVLNRVMTLDAMPRNNSAVLVDERLFFIDADRNLHVTDGSPEGSQILLDNIARPPVVGDGLVALDNSVFVLREIDDDNPFSSMFDIWSTDGTLTNTQRALDVQLSDFELLFGRPMVSGDRIFLGGSDNQLIVTDGTNEGSQAFPAASANIPSICASSPNNFYFLTRSGSQPTIIMHALNGSITPINLPVGFTFDRSNFPIRQFLIGSDCVYVIRDVQNNDRPQLVRMATDGTFEIITIPTTSTVEPPFLVIDRFQDSLLVARGSLRRDNTIGVSESYFQVSPDTPDLISLADTDFGVSRARSIQTSANSIFAFIPSPPLDPPPLPVVARFNSDLELIEGFIPARDSDNTFSDIQVANMNGTDIFYNRRTLLLDTFNTNGTTAQLRTSDVTLPRFIGKPENNNQAIYAFAADQTTTTVGLYRLENSPNVSERLVGIWSNPELDRQGVQINTGVSEDGQTRLLFASLLVHRDGEPVWLSGGNVIEDGRSSISLNLSIFSGLPFLIPDANAQAQQDIIGIATISVLSCDRIRVQLDLDDTFGNRDLIFDRLVDRAFTRLCNDLL